ncbi:MAG TPA: hypothetical protein VFH83_07830, partial [Spirochaetia bacterium]|nr:hypothetical protein [Spirochaetia bacterium]
MNDARDKVVTRRRLTVVAVVLSLLALAVVVQLVRLMVVAPLNESQQTLVIPEVQRGSILDRQGRILAVSVRQQRVSAW